MKNADITKGVLYRIKGWPSTAIPLEDPGAWWVYDRYKGGNKRAYSGALPAGRACAVQSSEWVEAVGDTPEEAEALLRRRFGTLVPERVYTEPQECVGGKVVYKAQCVVQSWGPMVVQPGKFIISQADYETQWAERQKMWEQARKEADLGQERYAKWRETAVPVFEELGKVGVHTWGSLSLYGQLDEGGEGTMEVHLTIDQAKALIAALAQDKEVAA